MGPQRSGTRITSKILSHELEYDYVDEADIDIDSLSMLNDCLQYGRVVIQAPSLTNEIVNIDNPDIGFVIVKRPLVDIIKSQERINWRYEGYEKSKFGHARGPIAKVKYDFWRANKKYMNNAFEINYSDLSRHRMFLSKRIRSKFIHNQTEKR